jgi:hypothetical protein
MSFIILIVWAQIPLKHFFKQFLGFFNLLFFSLGGFGLSSEKVPFSLSPLDPSKKQ